MNKSFIKDDISNCIKKEIGLSFLISKKITNDIIDVIIKQIASNHLLIKNFGTFHLKEKQERLGRNPKTLEVFTIKKRKVVIFRPSSQFTKKLNQIN
ncbi:MAG: HU family DNA-binding protein [Pseudomonadota bacterium]|nr:HU family DNA-binding protein [Pseudomonadota bacterium]